MALIIKWINESGSILGVPESIAKIGQASGSRDLAMSIALLPFVGVSLL